MKTFRLLVVTWLLAATPAFAGGLDGVNEFYLYPSFQYFQWEEFDAGGRILKETGPLFGAGAAVSLESPKLDSANSMTFKAKVELFGSVVDYDGETQPPNAVPVGTDVTYLGTKGEIDVGLRHTIGAVFLEPFGGAGIRWWLRDLHDTTAVDAGGNSVRVQGYEEEWLSAYVRVGLRGGYTVAKNFRLFAEAGAKYPFHTENSVDFPGVSVTVKPQGKWSAFAEIGAQYGWFRPSIFYEGFRYSDSPVVDGLFQPRSESDIIGVNLGIAFR
jgi:hypothetical protein